jgi:hypothetical protein
MANTAVFGIYATRTQVEQAVDRLRLAGFRPTDISVLFPENVGTRNSRTRSTRRLRKAPRPARHRVP